MSMFVEILKVVLYTALGSGVFWSIYYFIFRSLFNHFLNRNLEQFKHNLELETEKFRSQLRADAFEREIRFSRLHQVRMKVIAEIYSLLVRTQYVYCPT